MEIVFGFLVVIAVIAVAAVLFCIWVAVEIGKTVVRMCRPRPARARPSGRQACGNADCRGDNPDHARFCRRCGRPLPALMRLVDARAA